MAHPKAFSSGVKIKYHGVVSLADLRVLWLRPVQPHQGTNTYSAHVLRNKMDGGLILAKWRGEIPYCLPQVISTT